VLFKSLTERHWAVPPTFYPTMIRTTPQGNSEMQPCGFLVWCFGGVGNIFFYRCRGVLHTPLFAIVLNGYWGRMQYAPTGVSSPSVV